MDQQERYIYRHKRQRIVHLLASEPGFLYQFMAKNFAGESKMKEIRFFYDGFLKNGFTRGLTPTKILDVLINANDRGPIEAFLKFLRKTFPDLHDELAIEMAAEREELILDPRIKNEARHHVQRNFGTDKRLSEGEKRKVERLLSVRMQVLNDTWSRKMDRIRSALRRNESLVEECDKTVERIAVDLDERMEARRRRMLKLLPEEKLKRTKSTITKHEREYPPKDAWKKLERSLAEEDVLFDHCLARCEEIAKERSKVLKLLNLEDDWSKIELDKEVKMLVDKSFEEMRKLKKSMNDERMNMRRREDEMMKMMYEYSKQIDDRERNSKAADKKMRQISVKLDDELKETRENLLETKNELSKWKIKCESLEISRRVPSLPGGADKAKKEKTNATQTPSIKLRKFSREPKPRISTLPKITSEESTTTMRKRK